MNTFFTEAFNRIFKSRSPAFMKRVRSITAWLTLAGLIPIAAKRYFNVDLPEGTVILCKDIAQVAIGLCGGTFLAKKDEPVGQTLEGAPVTVTDEEKFPFSAKKEKKETEKKKPPPPVLPSVPETPPETTNTKI